jgi:hypothetical protein
MRTLYKYFFLLLSCAIVFACGGGGGGGGDTTQPTTPTGLTASATSASQIDLSWTASTDNVGTAGYKIYRNGVYLKSESGVSTSDTGLSAGTQYCYTVSACDAANNESAQSVQVCAATPVPVWSKTYDMGIGQSVKQTSDGGYIIVGTVEYNVGNFLYLLKTDATGETLWKKTYVFGSGKDYGRSVQQTSDGGYIILGEFTIGSNRQMWLVKIDANGNSEWDRFYGYDNYNEDAAEVQQTSDGGYILIGTTLQTPSNVFLVKTDKDGNVVWYKQKGYDDSGEIGTSVRQTSDHGFIFTGSTNQFDRYSNDLWLVKLDPNGNTVWHQHYGNQDNHDTGNSVRQTTDGGYIIAGSTWIPFNQEDFFLLKTDSVGNQQWSRKFGGPKTDSGAQVDLTNDGGYVMAGFYSHDTGDSDGYLAKLDAQGTPLWENIFGGRGYDYFYSVTPTADGGYIMTGSIQQGGETYVYLVKTDSKGSSLP